ncbi:MAG: tripartite tricarboxylate transporter substrate binding protein [Burkholderiales bacterium]
MKLKIKSLMLAVTASILIPNIGLTQSYPTKPVRLIVPYAAGGAVDAMARAFGQKYGDIWGQTVIVENRAGAGGNIGSDVVAKSAPDGHTLLINTSGQAVAPALYKKLSYDAVKDLSPISGTVASALILVAPLQSSATSVKEFIALARAQPGKLNFGSTGIGSGPHLSQEMFKSMAGIEIVHIPYKGDAPLFPALFTNEVQLAVVPSQTALAHIKAGKLRVLAVTNAKRSAALPDVPTVGESGLPGYEFGGWTALFASGGTPREVIRKIAADTTKMLAAPEVTVFYPRWGVELFNLNTEEMTARYLADIEKFTKIIREAKIPQVD